MRQFLLWTVSVLLLGGMAYLWTRSLDAPDGADAVGSRPSASPSDPDAGGPPSPRLGLRGHDGEIGSPPDVGAGEARVREATRARTAAVTEGPDEERWRRRGEYSRGRSREERVEEDRERASNEEGFWGGGGRSGDERERVSDEEGQRGPAGRASDVESLDEIVRLLSSESWISEPSNVPEAVEAMNMLYAESRERGYLEHDIEGHKHVIDRVLDEATVMLFDKDEEGARLLMKARGALARDRLDEAERLIRQAVEAYQ